MKESEAIEWIKELRDSEEIRELYYVESFVKACDMAIQALEKQIQASLNKSTSKCEKCTYYGRPSDAPESTPLDCIYRPEEGEEYKPPCEEREAQYEL